MSIILRVFITSILFAAPKAGASEIFENFVSARAMGMGNAFSAVVDNQDALFYNPAALDRIQGVHLVALSPALGTDAADILQTYNNAVGSNYATMIHQFYGKQVWVGIQDALVLAMRGFAIAGYDSFNTSINLHNPAYSNLNFNVTNDVGFTGGFALSLLPNNAFRLGATLKRITRYGGRVPFGPSTLATLSNAQLTAMVNNYGTGYGADGGVLLEIPSPSKPTFSAVWHDLGQTQFTPQSGTTTPPPLDNELVFGYSMLWDLTVLKIQPAVDFKHAFLWDEQLGKRLHVGMEMQFPALSVRVGANQGYWTAGVGFDLHYLRIDAATYGVELETYPGQQEDRRYLLQATLDFNFGFGFLGGGGSGKKTRPGESGGSDSISPSYQRR